MSKRFPSYRQHDAADCGPTCLRMIAAHYGRNHHLSSLRELSHITRDGVTMLGISDAAESIGFNTLGVNLSYKQVSEEAPLPCIVHWEKNHFVVVYDIKKRLGKEYIYVADPAKGKTVYDKETFLKSWLSADNQEGDKTGICLLLEPTEKFFEQKGEKQGSKFRFILTYLKPHRGYFFQLILSMILGSMFMLVFPFLTQAIIDVGIRDNDLNFITLILIAMLSLFAGQITVEFLRSWILLHISTRVNIVLISDFLIKILKLPIGFFNSKRTGDLIQRILDHDRIQSFLTISSLNIIFSAVNLLIFGLILLLYNSLIFFIFLAGTLLYILWVNLFMRKRKELDYVKFSNLAENQNNLIQMITGMQEIKLNNSEKEKRWEWEKIQAKLFQINHKSLSLTQYQNIGALFFIRTKDILITFISASLVIKGEFTLGMMMAVQYILGQLNSPIENLVAFSREGQDASISMERLDEIKVLKEEEDPACPKIHELPVEKELKIENLSFQYEGPHSPFVLKNINLVIPEKKITAIVGASGSGKTTLIKLLLGFYPPVSGDIYIGQHPLKDISGAFWRSKCGAVMQDGFIFSDSISHNIAMSEEINEDKLKRAISIANLGDFIGSLPFGVNTRIGQEGSGISEGQKQRILIARAVYKDPEFIFFDEATNSLDANNEKMIIDNLDEFFKGKTVVIVAHRLSTVKNADQIIVLEDGKIIEKGEHNGLISIRGAYFMLVKNQLELGN
jgi:ATP-binding cassette, subfamily B, bacterial